MPKLLYTLFTDTQPGFKNFLIKFRYKISKFRFNMPWQVHNVSQNILQETQGHVRYHLFRFFSRYISSPQDNLLDEAMV